MLVLFETAAGFALFKLLDEGKLKEADLSADFETPQKANKVVALKKFSKFDSTADALASTTALIESSLSKDLQKFLKKNVKDADLKEKLLVADAKLGSVIKEKLGIKCVHDSAVQELMRGIRLQLANLVGGLSQQDINNMALGLSHSLSRYKLKFSPDKVDTMIVQAISLLDDMDKELNIYAMRVREWYGWHFPELGRVVTDNLAYARTVRLMGPRTNALSTDLAIVLPEEMVTEVKDLAQISMGTEVSEEDIEHVKDLCDQVISISEYREQLFDYLKSRMNAMAPNLTVMVGELVGARLISHAGSLMTLAKYPASTIQILGAEKALFRSLKTKQATPKYGLIYHASLVGQAKDKNRGKISRVLAAKTALSVRVDALGETEGVTLGLGARAAVEHRLKVLESGGSIRAGSQAKKGTPTPKYDPQRQSDAPSLKRERVGYDTSADVALKKQKIEPTPTKKEEKTEKAEKTPKKTPKKAKDSDSESSSSEEEKKSKKSKKTPKKEESSDDSSEEDKKSKKKDKKKTPKKDKSDDSDSDSDAKKKDKKKSKKTPSKKKESSSESDSSSEEEKPKAKKRKA